MPNSSDVHKRAAAACGQSSIMALYDLMFGNMDLACSQLLITRNDFLNENFKTGISEVCTTPSPRPLPQSAGSRSG